MNLITGTTQIRVSSSLEKSTGKKNLTDGSPETCWSSAQGTPQHIQVSFDSLVVPQVISLTFQGGFAGLRCALYARSRNNTGDGTLSRNDKVEGDGWLLVDRFFPEDVNRKQIFSLAVAVDPPSTGDVDTPRRGYDQVKIVFEESSDFFGRIVRMVFQHYASHYSLQHYTQCPRRKVGPSQVPEWQADGLVISSHSTARTRDFPTLLRRGSYQTSNLARLSFTMDGQEWALPILFDGVDVSYFRPFFQLSSLSSAHVTEFCSSREGWGPVSLSRDFDFTPCFEQGVLIPAGLVLFILFSVPRILQLARVPHPREHLRGKKSRLLLYSKIALLLLVIVTSVANFVFVVLRAEDIFHDPSLYAAIIQVVALSIAPVLTYFNHGYTRRSSTILLVFYPYHITSIAISLRTQFAFVSNGDNVRTSAAHFAVSLAGLALITATWFLECFGPEIDETLDNDFVKVGRSVKESPFLTANAYSRLAFIWMTPLMRLGSERFIVQEDLNDLLPEDASGNVGEKLQHYWEKEMQYKRGPSLWRALAYSYGPAFALAAVLKVFTDLLAFAQPLFLHLLLAFISEYQRDKEHTSGIRGFAICGLMFISAIAQSAILHQYFQICFVTGSRVRAGLVMVIYRKSLVLSNDEKTVRGDIVNLMSVDASRLQELCTYALIAISGPFQIALAFISLYKLLGWPAFVGVAVMVLAIPINTAIARFLKKLQETQMKNRDGRTRMMSELLNNIKSIKLYAWEHTFIKKILAIRNDRELKMLRKIGITNAISTVFWSCVPLLVALASFATAAYASDTPLTSEIIFPSLTLFMLLQFPLGMFAMITSSIISSMVSVARLSKFLQSPELQPDARTYVAPRPSEPATGSDAEAGGGTSPCSLSTGDVVLSIRDGELRWSKDSIESTLDDIHLDVKMGELIGVFGRVGAGKSSLLSAIIGEMTRSEGTVELYGTVAYAPRPGAPG